jgi:hypothetical protein
MSHQYARYARSLLLAGPALLLLAAIRPTPAPQPVAAADTTYIGTVRTIRPDQSVDLLIGVGYALRVIHIGVVPATATMRAGVAIRVSDLAPGDLVRAKCHLTDQGPVADRIEKLGPGGAEPEPGP